MEHPVEPFKIKVVEPITLPSPQEREQILREAHYNLFMIPADKVFVDLLTDSGTGAMSQEQWAGLMVGDESYASAKSWFRFKEAVQSFTGMPEVIPTHQGRAAEKIVASVLVEEGDLVVSNTFFDTTRANFEAVGARVLDLPCPEARDLDSDYPFKGNLDLDALEDLLRRERVRLLVMTLTNNTGGGQPVSVENLAKAAEMARERGALVMLDICRIAENAYFIKVRDPKRSSADIGSIVRELISHADLVTMSAKKDAISNIGGFIACRDPKLAERFREMLILWEGFITYGGLAGRDLEAIAQGLREGVREDYLAYRIKQTEYLARGLRELGYPVLWPPGGHAVYIEASRLLPHIPRNMFPGHSLAVELYREGAVRSVEVGSLMFGGNNTHEFVRLAIPRRTYTQAHMDWVIRTAEGVLHKRDRIPGYRITWEPPHLRHFLAHLEPVS